MNKVYHAWTYCNHNRFYSLGYFECEADAWEFLNTLLGPRSGASPECGVTEIDVIQKKKNEN